MEPGRHDVVHRRERSVAQLGALELLGDPALERVARVAAAVAGTPHAAVHVFDAVSQHRIAAVDAPLDVTPVIDTLCQVPVADGAPTVVGDVTLDPRFAGSPFVEGDDPVRFYAASPLRVAGQVPIGTVCVWDLRAHEADPALADVLDDLAAMVVDHLEAAHQARVFAELANTDLLTGLPNRRMLFDHLQALLVESRPTRALTVAVLDLDGFKAVNDRRGHEAGDEVLRTIGERLRALDVPGVLHARLGGDEFVVVCDRSTVDVDLHLAAVVAAISRPIPTDAGEAVVGASIGRADAWPDDTPDAMIRRADVAMFVAKRSPSTARVRAAR